MTRILAVTGATGVQGGGIINIMKNQRGWKIRAITRNTSSQCAIDLVNKGIEVVAANYDDEKSLSAAFIGVHAIFAVTNWWEHLQQGNSPEESDKLEEQQGMNLANAAASIPTLQHYIWSTTPHVNGYTVPHFDSKARVDKKIREELPALASITTYLSIGWYPQNIAYIPFMQPFINPITKQYMQLMPFAPQARHLVSGDMNINPGVWVRGILSSGSKAHGKYANVALEKLSFQEMLDIWAEVTGKKAMYVQATAETFTNMWGAAGHVMGLQNVLLESCDPWEETDQHVSYDELGIKKEDIIGYREALEGMKQMWE
ncbi:NAD(P)-binding protein [Periconia macrospinosa]|uniref:NAD(P)-binding protein n=1 Tax=Periconia macrospinosa TaxID=97972 RepID=A0A2V1E501_9PLEO|nr:NAD(P)-binding protein [Periconia macrospinosa]